MIGSEIIALFETFIDDLTELSAADELALLIRVYLKVSGERDWEILKTAASGSITGNYITLPADFGFMSENAKSTSQNVEDDDEKVIFVGSNYTPYKIVNYSDRRQYRDQDGYAYLDMGAGKIYFTCTTPSAGTTYEFDYIKVPADLTLATSPVFPARFHPMFAYAMAVDDAIIQMFDKAKSYAADNQAKYDSYMEDMVYWNSRLLNLSAA